MLKHLSITNYALIENLEINFFNNFSVITGETGSGKSIILDAIHLIMGNRADIKTLFNNQKKCIVEGLFVIEKYKLDIFFSKNDLDYDPKHTILRREINQNGKSRAFINDCPVKLNQLKELSSKIIDVHSQKESLMLNNSNYQLDLIDQLASSENSSHQNNLSTLKKEYYLLKKLKKSLEILKNQEKKSKEKQDYFNYLFNELENANLTYGEKDKLERRIELEKNKEIIITTLQKISYIIDNNHQSIPIYNQLIELNNDLLKITKIDTSYKDLSTRLSEIIIELSDISKESDSIVSNIEEVSSDIKHVNDRLNLINHLEQKHQINKFDDLFKKKIEIEKKILNFKSFEQNYSETKKQIKILEKSIESLLYKITNQRNKVIPNISLFIERNIQKLGIKNTKFKIKLIQKKNYSELGRDEVKFLFSANKGIPLQEMNKVSSGGENSRLMLSIKAILAMHIPMPTLILDEIDTGVSGKIAGKIAKFLQNMSKNLQLIVISHLPQVAAKADFHYKVLKIEKKDKMETTIYLLKENEKIEELTKMLSSEKLSEAARENAKVLRMNK